LDTRFPEYSDPAYRHGLQTGENKKNLDNLLDRSPGKVTIGQIGGEHLALLAGAQPISICRRISPWLKHTLR
jgi:hypothetical protein